MNKFIFWGAAFVLVVGAWFAGRYSMGDSDVVEPTLASEQVATNDSEQARVQLEKKLAIWKKASQR